jgi:hypothetical protein
MSKCLCISEYGDKSINNLFTIFDYGKYYDFEMIGNNYRIYAIQMEKIVWVEYIPEYFYKYFSISELIDEKISNLFR